MKYQLTRENIQCFSSVASGVINRFEGEHKKEIEAVIFKINDATSIEDGKYEAELDKNELDLLAELFAKASENEEVKNSELFKELKKVFAMNEKVK